MQSDTSIAEICSHNKHTEFNRIAQSRYSSRYIRQHGDYLKTTQRSDTRRCHPRLVAIAGLLHHPGKLAKIYLAITILICLLNHFLDLLEGEVFTQLFGNTLNINI